MFLDLFKKFMIVAGIYLIFQIPPIKEKTQPYFEHAYDSFEQTVEGWFGAAKVREFRSGSDSPRRTTSSTQNTQSSLPSVSEISKQSWFDSNQGAGSKYSN